MFSWSTVTDSDQHQRLIMIRSFEIMRIGGGPTRSRIVKHCYNATSVDLIIKNCNKRCTFNNNNGAERRILDLQIIKEQIQSQRLFWIVTPPPTGLGYLPSSSTVPTVPTEQDLECNPTLNWAGDKKPWQQQQGFAEKHRIFGQSFAGERVSVQRCWETCWADCLLGFQMF